MSHIISDIIFSKDIEIVSDHEMNLFKLCSLYKEIEEEKSIILKTIMSLSQKSMLICVVEERLDIDDVIYGAARN